MNNTSSCLLCWINEKVYCYQSYVRNHNINKIAILVDNWGGHNKNNVMILFMNIIKEGGLFGTDIFHFYIKGHTNNKQDHIFNSLKVLYRKQNGFTLENFCEILNTSNNVGVIKTLHEKFFDLE